MCMNKTRWLKFFLSFVEFENNICAQLESFDTENYNNQNLF